MENIMDLGVLLDEVEAENVIDDQGESTEKPDKEFHGVKLHGVELTEAQLEVLAAAQELILEKERGQLMCRLTHLDFTPRPDPVIQWQGHASTQGSIYSEDTGKGFVELLDNSFAPYHKKSVRRPTYEKYDLRTDEDEVYLDAEADPKYENASPGTVTCEGYAIDVWEWNLYFGEKKWEHDILIHAGTIPGNSVSRILSRLQAMQAGERPLGLDPIRDYEDLAEFAGNARSGFCNSPTPYDALGQSLHLRMLLNRRDAFLDFTSQLYVSTPIHRMVDGFAVWDFLRQMILGYELGRRLAAGLSWSGTDFTPRLLATILLADQWLDNVKVMKYDEIRQDTKCRFGEISKRAKSQNADAEAEVLKNKGNQALAKNDVGTAISLYTQAIERFPENAVYFSNRAGAYFRLKKFVEAEKDANSALEIDPAYAKAWSWLGAVMMEMGQYEPSVHAYEWAVEMEGAGGSQPMKAGLTKAKLKAAEKRHLGIASLSSAQQQSLLAEDELVLRREQFKLKSLVLDRQTKELLTFAEMMRWPYLEEVREYTNGLYRTMLLGVVDTVASVPVFDWLFGLSLPGKWFSMKIGQVLVHCTPSLKAINANVYYDAGISLPEVSYWRARTVLGRVLGSLLGVRSVCGWIGPCPPVEGPLGKFVRLKTPRVKPKRKQENAIRIGHYERGWGKHTIQPQPEEDVDVWGRDIQDDSLWVVPKAPEKDNNTYELRNLRLTALPLDGEFADPNRSISDAERDVHTPYLPSIEFHLGNGSTVTYTLHTNPTFVTLPPCYNAPANQHSVHRRELPPYLRNRWKIEDLQKAQPAEYESESVMVVNASGDGAETIARAWCSEKGKNAGIRRAGGPCFLCAYNAVSMKGLYLEVLIWVSSADEPVPPCKVCLDLSLGGVWTGTRRKLSVTLEEIERSAERGCPSCEVLQKGIELSDKTNPSSELSTKPQATLNAYLINQRDGYSVTNSSVPLREPLHSSDRVINGAFERGCGLCLTYLYRKTKDDLCGTAAEIDLFVKQGAAPCPWKSIGTATDISGNTASEQSFSRARYWLDLCDIGHKMCCSSRRIQLPDRVLDLGAGDNPNDQSHIVLRETSKKTVQAGYACLSHCWGQGNHIKTTSRTLQKHNAGIAWNDLPRTFQDAITFTRRLGIRYLWIDSLCIIQDNPKDLFVQLSKMPEIYENAYITLAATFSSSNAGGCFSHARSEFKAREFSVRDRSGKSHQIFVRRHLPHWLMADPRHTPDLEEDFPLLKRAWVLQERLLSPRVLHFGRDELMWECMEGTACECSFLDHVEAENVSKIMHHRNLTQGKQSRSDLGMWWRNLVSLYSRLAMTFEKDKLQAISGLAQQMNRTLKDTYVAGLWKSSLIADMLWETHHPQTRPSPWRAPSWSWASVKSPFGHVSELKNIGHTITAYAKIERTEVVPAGQDKMGQLTSANLTVTAQFCVGSIIVYTKASDRPNASPPQLMVHKRLFNPEERSNAGLQFVYTNVSLDITIPPTTTLTHPPEYGSIITGRGVLCMRLAKVEHFEYNLLLQCIDHPSGKYERIGIVGEYKYDDRPERLPWGDPDKCFFSTLTLL